MGHLVGVTMNRLPAPESDAMLFVDGDEWPPACAGTGNAGFFNQAWDAQTVSWPLSSTLLNLHGMNGFLRLLFPYPVDFRERLVLSFERGHANAMRQDYSSTAYWYQEEPHFAFPHPLPAAARQFREEALEQPEWLIQNDKAEPSVGYEAEETQALAIGGLYEPQDMLPFGPDWSGNQQIRFEPEEPGAYIEFHGGPLSYSGFYNIQCSLTQAPDAGITAISMNNHVLFPYVDLYGKTTKSARMKTTQPEFYHASETPVLRFESSGANSASKGNVIGIDSFHWEQTQTVPKTITVQGPYQITPDNADSLLHTKSSHSTDDIILGYETSSKIAIAQLKPDEDGKFQFGQTDDSDDLYA
ncbi:DUF2961 domain-containing protein, partial [bacterium]|nr:DUF2961 domain-containing protein [bacterium]